MEKAVVFNRRDLIDDFGTFLPKYFNLDESSIYEAESGEKRSFTFVFDIPSGEIDHADLESYRDLHSFSYDENPGGLCTMQSAAWEHEHKGFIRFKVLRTLVYDI